MTGLERNELKHRTRVGSALFLSLALSARVRGIGSHSRVRMRQPECFRIIAQAATKSLRHGFESFGLHTSVHT
ncbi:hypothetical protein T492DRAFT_1048195, partial [Pavlovales sp. CCMP2436]